MVVSEHPFIEDVVLVGVFDGTGIRLAWFFFRAISDLRPRLQRSLGCLALWLWGRDVRCVLPDLGYVVRVEEAELANDDIACPVVVCGDRRRRHVVSVGGFAVPTRVRWLGDDGFVFRVTRLGAADKVNQVAVSGGTFNFFGCHEPGLLDQSGAACSHDNRLAS